MKFLFGGSCRLRVHSGRCAAVVVHRIALANLWTGQTEQIQTLLGVLHG